MFKTRVLTLLWLFFEVVSPFSWDIVVSGDKTLEFYDNGTLTHKKEIPEATEIYSIAYDPVQNRVLICDHVNPNASISSYDISTNEIQHLFTRETDGFNISSIEYDPVTELLFLRETRSIWSFSLNPAASKKARDGKEVVAIRNYCYDIAVDSNGGYLYWITSEEIERIRFDGSHREVLIRDRVLFRLGLAIDQEAQKMYWIEFRDLSTPMIIESANLLGQNRTTVYSIENLSLSNSLAVTKDFFYWQESKRIGTWQLPKDPSERVARKLDAISSSECWSCHRVVGKYTINKQN